LAPSYDWIVDMFYALVGEIKYGEQ